MAEDISERLAESQMNSKMRELHDMITGTVCEDVKSRYKELDQILEFACRHLVLPPIKGKITRGKVKWRGLRLVFVPSEMKMEKDGDKMNFSYEQRWELWQRDRKIF